MEAAFAHLPLSRTSFPPLAEINAPLAARAQDIAQRLAQRIERTANPDKLEGLLTSHDAITDLLAGRWVRPKLELRGLGLDLGRVSGSPPPMDEEEVGTPRIDKGKARARPEPAPVEKVLTPIVRDPHEEMGQILGFGEEEEEEPRSPAAHEM